jgi:hypothetical protein
VAFRSDLDIRAGIGVPRDEMFSLSQLGMHQQGLAELSGSVHLRLGESMAASRCFLALQALATREDDMSWQIEAATGLASAADQSGQLASAEGQYDAALALAEATADVDAMTALYARRGALRRRRARVSEADVSSAFSES